MTIGTFKHAAATLTSASLLLSIAIAAQAQGQPAGSAPPIRSEVGFGLFQQRCLGCHGNAAYERAPPPPVLREMSPERILEALTTGVMSSVGATLSQTERRLVAESISGRLLGTSESGQAAAMPNQCPSNPPIADPAGGAAWNGWGADLTNARFQPARTAGLDVASVERLKLKWAFGFPGGTSAFGQPSIVSGRVFVGTDTGFVYALDAQTGCVLWSFETMAGVRNAMTIGPARGASQARYAVYFGDLKANVYALDAQTGAPLWTRHVEEHYTGRVTAAPALYEGRLYVPISSWEEFSARSPDYPCCTAVGNVVALDAATGTQIWKTYVIPVRPKPAVKNSKGVQQWAPAGGSVWNTPTVDPGRRAIYFGTGDATTDPAATTTDAVMALDMDNGKVLWSYQVHENDTFLVGCVGENRTENCPKVQGPDWDIPSSPILHALPNGSRQIIVGTKPGDVLALDPDRNGALLWRMNVHGPVIGNGPLPAGTSRSGVQWGGAVDDQNGYFGLTGGGMAAVRLDRGERLWYTPLNSTNQQVINHGAAATVIPGVVFVGGSDGRLFAVATADGSELWRFDTARTFNTVNKVQAKGGSIMAPGPTVADGMLFIGSGYSTVAGQPGNVLLAFAAE
jgi:polyvinyl alcohol dehydrogenase (cytochrome)